MLCTQVLQPRSQWISGKLENIINELSIDNTETHKEEKVDEMKNQVDNHADVDAHNVENYR